MWFLLLQIFLLLLVAAALGGAIAYLWLKSRFEDVTEAHEDLQAQVRRLDKQADPATREDVRASAAGVSSAIAALRMPDLAPVQERLQRVEQAIGAIKMPEVDLSSVRWRLEVIEAHLKGPNPAMDQVRTSLGALEGAIAAVSSSVARLGNPDLGPIETQLAQIEQEVRAWKAPDVDLGPVHSGLITLQLTLEELKTASLRLEPVQQGLADVQTAVAGIAMPETDLRPIEAALADLGNMLDSVERGVAKLDRPPIDLQPTYARLEQVEHRVAGLLEAVQGMPPPDLSPVLDTVLSIDSRQDLAALENRLTAIEYSLTALHHMLRSRPEPELVRNEIVRRTRPGVQGNGEGRTAPGNPAREFDPIDRVRKPGDRANLLAQPAFGPPDNLEQINGVGPHLRELLNSIGVFYFWQVAEWSEDDAAWVDGQLQHFRGRIRHDDWIGHARQLVAMPASAKRPMAHDR